MKHGLNIYKDKIMERGFLFIIAITLAFGVGVMGSKRMIGFGWVISLLNVVIGLIVVLCSRKLTPEELEEKEKGTK